MYLEIVVLFFIFASFMLNCWSFGTVFVAMYNFFDCICIVGIHLIIWDRRKKKINKRFVFYATTNTFCFTVSTIASTRSRTGRNFISLIHQKETSKINFVLCVLINCILQSYSEMKEFVEIFKWLFCILVKFFVRFLRGRKKNQNKNLDEHEFLVRLPNKVVFLRNWSEQKIRAKVSIKIFLLFGIMTRIYVCVCFVKSNIHFYIRNRIWWKILKLVFVCFSALMSYTIATNDNFLPKPPQ